MIGPKMEELARLVAERPGRITCRYAEQVGPNGSLRFGYRTVARAVRAGLVARRPDPAYPHRTRLFPVEEAQPPRVLRGGGYKTLARTILPGGVQRQTVRFDDGFTAEYVWCGCQWELCADRAEEVQS